METNKIEISQKTILFTIGAILSLWFLYQVRSIVVLLFIAFILMTAVNPLIKLAKKIKIPTIVVMLIVYFGLIALISTVVASLVPALVQQTKDLTLVLPTYMHNIEVVLNAQFDPNVIGGYLNSIPSNLLKIAGGVFSNIMGVLALFFMSYYMVLERPHLHTYLIRFFDNKNAEAQAEELVLSIERQVGGWVRGELFLMLIIGVMTYIGLFLLGVPYSLPLAVLAGLLEAVPNLGPTIAAIPAIIIGLTVSPMIALGTLILSIVIQQLENNLIVPKVMQSATGTKPLATIIVLLVGFTLGGIAGAILSMPIFLTLQTIYKAFSPSLGGRS
ncbi:MAG: AI-2E family transporter [Microgenomates group bacterium]